MTIGNNYTIQQKLFPDEGSGAEVLLRPGDAVIVRGASQLRGHLVSHV